MFVADGGSQTSNARRHPLTTLMDVGTPADGGAGFMSKSLVAAEQGCTCRSTGIVTRASRARIVR